MKAYHDLMRHVLENGIDKSDRTGTGTRSVFGYQMRFDLSEGFPLLTTKKLHLRSIIHELLWFLKGDTNIKYLKDNNVSIWDEWADENGDLGPVYGYQWRSWPVPFNIASYALLTMMMAQVCGLEAGEFIHTFGDAHLYSNHIEQAQLQLSRDFRKLPTMKINPEVKDLFAFKFEDFELEGYDPHPHIKAAVSV